MNPTVKSEDFTNAWAFTLALFWGRPERQGHSSLKTILKPKGKTVHGAQELCVKNLVNVIMCQGIRLIYKINCISIY